MLQPWRDLLARNLSMAKFCFYYGADTGVIDRMRRSVTFCWGNVEESIFDSFHLFVASDDHPQAAYRSEIHAGAISGYAAPAKTHCGSHAAEFFSEVCDKEWPLSAEWTGSFAAAAYSAYGGDITLCNDVLGHYPLYYSRAPGGFLGGTSLIAIGRTLSAEPDAIGILQRITSPFCNYGRRTLFRSVYRLLPGERFKWKTDGSSVRREYDNSLCGVPDTGVTDSARLVFDCLRNEISIALEGSREISIATSGGWDSRLILGGLPASVPSVRCLTYGGTDLYETRIAQRCAEAIGASHQCFPIDEKYFPSRRQIEELVKETESANYFEWFGMIEKARSSTERAPLLLGDLCESIDGRYIAEFSSKKARVNSFLGELAGRHETFRMAGEAEFKRWCEEKTSEITSAVLANIERLSPALTTGLTRQYVVAETARDLKTSFGRVKAHDPHYSAMYDELFIWFHRIRFLLGNQISWLSSAFQPVSPGLSTRFLRLITTIHPRHRIRKRLMNEIIGLPEFARLSRIPSAQIPFISSRAPARIKDAVWGLRSGVDQILIKRSLKKKNFEGRQRVLRSLDYVKEYRRRASGANVEGWFSGRFINGGDYVRLVRERAELRSWTLINVDIAAPANVSILLDLSRPDSRSVEAKIRRANAAHV